MNVYLMKLYSSFWSLSYARTISGRDMATHHDRNASGSDPSQKAAQDTLKLKFRACSNLLLARYCPAVTAFRFAASQWQRT